MTRFRINKRHAAAAAILAAAFVLSACSVDQTTETGEGDPSRKITAEEAKKRMESGDDIIILDVRTEEEYLEGHIPGAVLLPNGEIVEGELQEELPDTDQEILVYCRSGNRSAQAAKKLTEAGYTNVYDFGGINDWPYETESGSGGSVFGEFVTVDLDGSEVTQDIFSQAELTMVNIWATYCGPCIREMPDLGALHTEYADRGFQVVGLVSDVSAAQDEKAMEIVEQTGANYTHIVPNKELIENVLWQVQAVPMTIFVDKEGNQVGSAYAGAKEKDQWVTIIDEMLKEAGQ